MRKACRIVGYGATDLADKFNPPYLNSVTIDSNVVP